MTDNPLLSRQSAKAGRVTAEQLHDYCDQLNCSHFVRDSGKPYRMKQIEIAGEMRWTLERAA